MNPERELRRISFPGAVRSLLQWVSIGALYGIAAAVAIPASYVISPFRLDPFLHFFTRLVVWVTGVELRVHGRDKLDSAQPYLFVFNHVNLLDHLFVYYALKRCLRGVEKESHFRWPVYGALLRHIGVIPIPTKGNTRRAMESLDKLRDYFRRGISIVVIPEGTRSFNGALGPFKKGAFHLAVQAGAPIVPIVLVGAYEFTRKKDFRIFPRPIDMHIEDPVPMTGLTSDDVAGLARRVREIFVRKLGDSSPVSQHNRTGPETGELSPD